MAIHQPTQASPVSQWVAGIVVLLVLMIGSCTILTRSAEPGNHAANLALLSDSEVEHSLDVISGNRSQTLSDNQVEQLVAHLRQEYPFESIRERVPKRQSDVSRQPVNLTADSQGALQSFEEADYRGARTYGDDVRSRSLQLLHEEQVRDFVARDGNGYMRTPPPSAIHLEIAVDQHIPFDRDPKLTDSHRGAAVSLPTTATSINDILGSLGEEETAYHLAYPAYKKWAAKNNPTMMIDEATLSDIHRQSHDSFLYGYLMGYVRSLDEVAGFHPHQIRSRPKIDIADHRWSANYGAQRMTPARKAALNLDPTDPTIEAPRDAIWLLTELRLVSLLMHSEPVVYSSVELPNMGQLRNTKTVELDDFEKRGLKKLQAGHHIEIEPRQNEIRMLGAIRCATKCLKCHEDAQRGELLGAFTYTLTRKLPLPATNTLSSLD